MITVVGDLRSERSVVEELLLAFPSFFREGDALASFSDFSGSGDMVTVAAVGSKGGYVEQTREDGD